MTFGCDSFERICTRSRRPMPRASAEHVICKGVDEPATMRKFALLHVSGCRLIYVQLLCNSVMHSAEGHCFPREATLTGFETDCRISCCCAILRETCTN